MTISIAMCTYNSEKYIEAQLKSLLNQTGKADEVIICDDASKDKTVSIVQRFIADNQLKNAWHLYQNRPNKGYPGNFYYAMSLCTGDYVFLADQDDIWDARKLEHLSNVLEQHPEANLAACRFGLIDAEGNELNAKMAPSHSTETANLTKLKMADIFGTYQWPGMVLCYRRTWYENALAHISTEKVDNVPNNEVKIPHDFLLCIKASETDSFLQLDEELASHRRHEANTGKAEHRIRKLLNKDRKLDEIQIYIDMLQEIQHRNVLQTESGKQELAEKLLTMQDRLAALESGSIREVLKSAKKHKGTARAAAIMCDVLIAKQR
jgi:glycosyltransferase involved in cell wall biosynthesis